MPVMGFGGKVASLVLGSGLSFLNLFASLKPKIRKASEEDLGTFAAEKWTRGLGIVSGNVAEVGSWSG